MGGWTDKKTAKKKLPMISLFSGAGGLDLGLETAGFETRVCVEFDSWCVKTLGKNRSKWNIIPKDINDVSSEELMSKAGLTPKETVLLSAGPPCQSFSNLGKKEGTLDPRGRLLFKTIEIIKDVQPLVFLVENVEGLATLNNGKILEDALELFRFNGYEVNFGILNAADYGVPQKRKRIFFLGHREGKKLNFPDPEYNKGGSGNLKKWRSVEEALNELYAHKNFSKRKDNIGLNHSEEMTERMELIGPGQNFKVLPENMRPDCWKNGKHQGGDTFGRMKRDEPSLTIRTSAYNPTKGRYIHPWENRGLTTLEMAAIQTFPYKYRFEGPLVEVGKQIGNAVPPLLAKKIGKSIIKQIQDELRL